MTKYVAFLRAVNVGGNNIVKMETLREKASALAGFHSVTTYIQSGNVLFESKEKDAGKLEAKLHKLIQKDFGLDIDVMVRSEAELQQAVDNNPFAETDPQHKIAVYVAFMNAEPDKQKVKELIAASNEYEAYHIAGREMYCRQRKDTDNKLLFSGQFTEKKLGIRATARNITTCGKVIAKFKS